MHLKLQGIESQCDHQIGLTMASIVALCRTRPALTLSKAK